MMKRHASDCKVGIITSIGIGEYSEVMAKFACGKQTKHRYCSLALAEYLGCEQVHVLATSEAREKNRADYDRIGTRLGVDVKWQLIPDGVTEREQWEIFRVLRDTALELDDAKIYFDITHGYRTIPLIFLLAATFLRTAHDMDVAGIYYTERMSAGNGNNQDYARVIDLTGFLILQNWLEATRDFKSFGDARALGKLIRDVHGEFRRSGKSAHKPVLLQNLGTTLEKVSTAVTFGRVVEMRKEILELKKKTTGIERNQLEQEIESLGGIATPLELLLPEIIRPYYLMMGSGTLSAATELVDWHFDHQNWAMGSYLVRETLVSRAQEATMGISYLDGLHRRGAIEGALNRLPRKDQEGDVRELSGTWSSVRKYRNDLAHCGMRKDPITVNRLASRGEEIRKQFHSLMRWSDAQWREALGQNLQKHAIQASSLPTTADGSSTSQRILITPGGLSPGLLYTALLESDPHCAFIITSHGNEDRVNDACTRAGYDGEKHLLLMDEPLTGFNEYTRLANQIDQALESCDEATILVNITGGTTAMGFVVQHLGTALESKGCAVKLVAMIDGRTHEEQINQPFVRGKMVECPEPAF